ncbi:hypothetical protein GCM10022222_70310 [Amycolatopsis ultiminotia]|uniref:Uncharacterized protein n=1 Tax=Amycolatopsis ultiminotia TaxID=543629 RepID=A0ABP6Y0V2_9PSEU
MTVPELLSDVPNAPEAEPEGDALVEQLRERLPELAMATLEEQAKALTRLVSEGDLEQVRKSVRNRVQSDSVAILRETNPTITAWQADRNRLRNHLASGRLPVAATANPRDRVGHAAFGFALWLGMIHPLLCWQLSRVPWPGSTWLAVVAALIVSTIASLWLGRRFVARAGVRFSGRRALGGAGWPIATGLATTYVLLVCRLWGASFDTMGGFLAVLVWVLSGLVTVMLTFFAYIFATEQEKEEEPGQRLPPIARSRGFLGCVTATVGTVLVLSWTFPVPEWVQFVTADLLSLVLLAGTAPLTLSPELIPRRFSRDPERRGSPRWTRIRDELQAKVDEDDRAWSVAATESVRQRVIGYLNELRNPAYRTELTGVDRHVLGQMRPGDRVVTSLAGVRQLQTLIAGIAGGAVGIAGPRGVGKSTLLETYQAGGLALESNQAHIAVFESVPVRYDARDFVLHLFARTCEAVIDFKPPDGESSSPAPPQRRWEWLRRGWPFLATVLLWVGFGVLGSLAARDQKLDAAGLFTTLWWPLIGLLGGSALLYLAMRWRPGRTSVRPPAKPPVPPGDLAALRARARWALSEIELQQKYTTGWSGKVAAAGTEVGATGSHEVTRQPRTYPQLVHDFGDFLQTAVGCLDALQHMAKPSVVIILDELDKIVSPDLAQDFVNEVKALFGLDVPGFLFLVSVSEDALASFERRGLPVRDTFDSAFDAILRLDYLTLGDSCRLLNSRILWFPEPFACLCHSLSGGLPRELIRIARQVISADGSLSAAAERVVAQDLAGKRAGLRTVVARGDHDDELASRLVRHVEAHAAPVASVLVDAAAAPPVDPQPGLVELSRLQVETLGYLYYLGTVLETFGPNFAEADLQRGHTPGDGSFDTLASARQLFAVNARLAWLTLNAFRTTWHLRVVPAPES